MRPLTKISVLIAWTAVATAVIADPQYQIFDIGVIQVGDTASQGFQVSPAGVAVGRSFRSGGAQAFTWTQGGGLVGLPNLAGRSFAVSNSANDSGIVVGTAATTAFGSGRLPVIWQGGTISQLPLPAGETLGDATGVNASGVAVGSVDGGSTQQGVIYSGGTATIITQTTSTGCFFVTAFGINNSARIAGFGIDPNNAARNVGIVYDMGSPAAFEVGALPGANGALAFAVSNGGHVVGSSMMNQGSGLPFIWSQANGIVAIPLATGTSQGSARAVNTAGWVVGQDSSAFSIPFLWDGTTTYRLADLLPPGSGWDLSMNTSSSALGISDNGVIVGTGVHNGETHAYAMVPVTGTPTPSPTPSATPSPTASPTTTPVLPATHFEVIAPSMVATFQAFNFTVRALDQFNNTATGYTGTIHFTSTSQGNLPADSTLTNGFGTFSATLNTLGNQTITATDTLNASITGTSNTILVISDIVTPPPSPTPTPPTTPTPVPCSAIFINENFDAATAPALPAGWVSSFTPGPASCSPGGTCALGTNWATSTTNPVSPPNSVFHNAPGCVTDSTLDTPPFVGVIGTMVDIQHQFDLESGLDGAVLEISIGGGPFTDFLAAGGTFFPGSGYNGTISNGSQSPIAGRAAWTGSSGGYVNMLATLPPAVSSQQVRLRFRLATDCSGSGTGWRLDNIKVIYLIPCVTPSPTPTPPATPTPTATPSSTPAAQPLNVSTRLRVQTGDNAGIAGFIITGTVPKNVLLRGIGPSLTAFGVAGALANPTLDLRRPDGTRIRANNDWQEDPAQAAAIQATGLPPQNSLEAAIIETLDPGSYTVILRGMGMTSGVGLVEAYDLNQGVNSKLANLSTRAFVDTGDNIVIAGFVLGGSNGNDRAVLRGIGPSLTAFGVANALADPTLELRDSNGALLASNNDWQDDPAQAAELTAAGLAPTNPFESGIAMTLSPGAYTALLAGRNNGTGVGVVEVYDRGAP